VQQTILSSLSSGRRNIVEKRLALASYWLGFVSMLLALVFRILAMIGIRTAWPETLAFSYNTFLHGAEILLLFSIATSVIAWSQHPRG
jgi:hypothetical protein